MDTADHWVNLERLIEVIAPYARPWDEFLDEVRWSRDDQD